MIFYGSKATKIGELSVSGTKCAYCENTGKQQISVFRKYAHIYWIPFFPLGKKAVAECTHCKRTIGQKEFSGNLKNRYEEIKEQLKGPIWHWSGLGVLVALVAIISVNVATEEIDPRSELLKADLELLSANPAKETDSVSFLLKTFMNDFVNEEIKPSEFEYSTKINGDKILILIKIPNLKKVEKEGRRQLIEMIDMVADIQESIKDKKRYIGIQGKYSMMMLKTPTDFRNANIVSQKKLYEFYGPKPVIDE